MKKFSISKEKTDRLQSIFAVFKHYELVMSMADKETSRFIMTDIFPDVGLLPEDFQFCNIDIGNGVINFDDEKKLAEAKEKEKKK